MAATSDPRITKHALVEVTPYITLVGVVHDHPASCHRVRSVIADRQPSTLALELPPLAVPLFERYANPTDAMPDWGGEMSAAIEAYDGSTILGIDGPSQGFLSHGIESWRAGTLTTSDMLGFLRRVSGAMTTAIHARTAASLPSPLARRCRVGTPLDYAVDDTDDPRVQARDERNHVARARAVMDAMDPAAGVDHRDRIREDWMAAQLSSVSASESVVAVVGMGHLDALAERLDPV